jgi:uncharacterized protein (TIGR00730 family)
MQHKKDYGGLPRVDIHAGDISHHVERIDKEFTEGFKKLEKYPRSVTVFGSSMASRDSENYRNAELIGKKIVEGLKYTVVTGGGPGIMEAASKGAHEAGGQALGLSIHLPYEKGNNVYLTDNIYFTYFFTRKTMLTFAAEAYIFMPGGFGTFDELFNILTLIQTEKIPHVPIILFNSTFWNEFLSFIKDKMLMTYHTIDFKDLELFKITDSPDEIVDIIKHSPVSDWWRNIN